MCEPVQLPKLEQLQRKFFVLYHGLLTQEPAVAPVGSRLSVRSDELMAINLDVSSCFIMVSNDPIEHYRFEITAATPPRNKSWWMGDVLGVEHTAVSLEAGVSWIRRLGPLITQGVFMEDTIPPLDEGTVTGLLDNLASQFEARFEEIGRDAEAVRLFYEKNRNWKAVEVAVLSV